MGFSSYEPGGRSPRWRLSPRRGRIGAPARREERGGEREGQRRFRGRGRNRGVRKGGQKQGTLCTFPVSPLPFLRSVRSQRSQRKSTWGPADLTPDGPGRRTTANPNFFFLPCYPESTPFHTKAHPIVFTPSPTPVRHERDLPDPESHAMNESTM